MEIDHESRQDIDYKNSVPPTFPVAILSDQEIEEYLSSSSPIYPPLCSEDPILQRIDAIFGDSNSEQSTSKTESKAFDYEIQSDNTREDKQQKNRKRQSFDYEECDIVRKKQKPLSYQNVFSEDNHSESSAESESEKNCTVLDVDDPVENIQSLIKDKCVILSDSEDDAFPGGTSESVKDNHLNDDILRAKDNEAIFLRSVQKFQECQISQKVGGQQRKGNRIYNAYHACFFCGKLVQHIRIHLKSKHKTTIGEGKEEEITLLRFKGDHKHNTRVMKEGGELLLKRRPTKAFNSKDYGPCPYCYECMLKNTIPRHLSKCLDGPAMRTAKRELESRSEDLSGRNDRADSSDLLRKEVLTIMNSDEISWTAQKDALIVSLGESWLRRNIGNTDKRKYYSSQRMRLNARFLREIQKEIENDELSMWDALKPQNFDILVKCALKTAAPYMDDTEDLQAPSNAIKLKYDIIRLINEKLYLSLQAAKGEKNHEKDKADCKDLMKLMKVKWEERVTKLARCVLTQRKLNKDIQIPSPEDIKKLHSHVAKATENVDLSEHSSMNYKRVATLLQTRLLTFNKRRSGETDAIKLKDYACIRKELSDVDKSISGDLSELECHLLKTTVDDCEREVLVPSDTKKLLAYVASHDVRRNVGIPLDNPYLCGTTGSGPVRSYDSLKTMWNAMSLSHPERITSVNLRKYTATLTQVFSLKDSELNWVCDHLGHTKKVHLSYYRQLSGVVERLHIAKLMMIQDLNLTSKFKGQSLSEIKFQDVVKPSCDVSDSNDVPAENVDLPDDPPSTDDDPFLFHEEEEKEEEEECMIPLKRRPPAKRTNRLAWTLKEVSELEEYFGQYLMTKTTPGRKDVERLLRRMKKNECECVRREPHLIIKKISTLNHRK